MRERILLGSGLRLGLNRVVRVSITYELCSKKKNRTPGQCDMQLGPISERNK
jgi:hypothetical protein